MQRRKLPDDRFKKKRQVQKPNTFRLFLGVFPPEDYISYFRDVIRLLDKQKRNIKPTPVDQIHITLKFIGSEVTLDTKNLILQELSKYQGQFPKPEIRINKIQFGFPYQKDPIHVLADIENSKDLIELADVIHDRIKVLGLDDTIRWKSKHFNDFHITIARLKPNQSRSTGRSLDELVENIKLTPPEPFIPKEMHFVESIITPQGPVYKKVGSITL